MCLALLAFQICNEKLSAVSNGSIFVMEKILKLNCRKSDFLLFLPIVARELKGHLEDKKMRKWGKKSKRGLL